MMRLSLFSIFRNRDKSCLLSLSRYDSDYWVVLVRELISCGCLRVTKDSAERFYQFLITKAPPYKLKQQDTNIVFCYTVLLKKEKQ